MKYLYYNPNPDGKTVSDCVVRAITKALESDGYTWDRTFTELMVQAFQEKDLPNSNVVWGKFLAKHGFEYHDVMKKCFDCYTINDFSKDHPTGTFVCGTDSHACTVIDGVLFDTFNSSGMFMSYYFEKISNLEGGVDSAE